MNRHGLIFVAIAQALTAARPSGAQEFGRFTAEMRGVTAGPIAGQAKFEFMTPDFLRIWLSDTTRREIVVLQLGRVGSAFPHAGTYAVRPGWGTQGLSPAGAFSAVIQAPGGSFDADTVHGRVVIEAADTLSVLGSFEIKMFRRGLPRLPTGRDTVWIAGRFYAEYDLIGAQVSRRLHGARYHAPPPARDAPPPRPVPPRDTLESFGLNIGRGVTGIVDGRTYRSEGESDEVLRETFYMLRVTPGAVMRYQFRADSGFRNLHVRGGPGDGSGRPLPDSGQLGGTAPRYLSATADLVVHIEPRNRQLFELTKAMYLARDPVPAYRKVFCEIERLARVYGGAVAYRLNEEVEYVLQSEWKPYWDEYWRVQRILDRVTPTPPCR